MSHLTNIMTTKLVNEPIYVAWCSFKCVIWEVLWLNSSGLPENWQAKTPVVHRLGLQRVSSLLLSRVHYNWPKTKQNTMERLLIPPLSASRRKRRSFVAGWGACLFVVHKACAGKFVKGLFFLQCFQKTERWWIALRYWLSAVLTPVSWRILKLWCSTSSEITIILSHNPTSHNHHITAIISYCHWLTKGWSQINNELVFCGVYRTFALECMVSSLLYGMCTCWMFREITSTKFKFLVYVSTLGLILNVTESSMFTNHLASLTPPLKMNECLFKYFIRRRIKEVCICCNAFWCTYADKHRLSSPQCMETLVLQIWEPQPPWATHLLASHHTPIPNATRPQSLCCQIRSLLYVSAMHPQPLWTKPLRINYCILFSLLGWMTESHPTLVFTWSLQ